jgi:hypothetical protein
MLALLFVLTTSCLSVDPYKIFEDRLQAEVGKRIDDARSPSRLNPSELISTRSLPNGNVQYRYAFENYRGICRYALEVDPATHRIVVWRYDGEDKDKACFVIP